MYFRISVGLDIRLYIRKITDNRINVCTVVDIYCETSCSYIDRTDIRARIRANVSTTSTDAGIQMDIQADICVEVAVTDA